MALLAKCPTPERLGLWQYNAEITWGEAAMEMKLELVTVPVSDADKAKEFYAEKVGFHVDGDAKIGDKRFIQLTPPGSACSIAIGENITDKQPGSATLLLVVDDIDSVYEELKGRGVDIAEPKQMPWKAVHADFQDPDGNQWTLQKPSYREK